MLKFVIVLYTYLGGNLIKLCDRNIPNKYGNSAVLQLINKKFKAKYDFWYLPIDFGVYLVSLHYRFYDKSYFCC